MVVPGRGHPPRPSCQGFPPPGSLLCRLLLAHGHAQLVVTSSSLVDIKAFTSFFSPFFLLWLYQAFWPRGAFKHHWELGFVLQHQNTWASIVAQQQKFHQCCCARMGLQPPHRWRKAGPGMQRQDEGCKDSQRVCSTPAI